MSVYPAIQVIDLCAVFDNENGGLHALGSLSFSVWPQEFVCVLGPSGSGKTTLLRILAGLLKPTRGQVMFADQPLQGPRRRTGIVFQKSNLMPWRDVLETGKAFYPKATPNMPTIPASAASSIDRVSSR